MAQPRTWVILFAAVITAVTGCRSRLSTLKNAMIGKDAQNLVYLDTVIFERGPDQKSATLSFKTKVELFCEISFWTQGNENSPTNQACRNEKGTSQVSEILAPLQPDTKYMIKVSMWLPELSDGIRKSFTISEDGDISNVTVESLLVSRSLIPQQTGEVNFHQFTSAIKVSDLRKQIIPELGCHTNYEPSVNEISKTSGTATPLKSVSSTGYATSKGKPHPHFGGRYLQSFENVQIQQSWEWQYQWNDTQYEFSVAPPAFLNKIILDFGGQQLRLKNKELVSGTAVAKLGDGDRLASVAWEVKNPRALSFLGLEIKKSGQGSSATCFFSGLASEAKIPTDIADMIASGEYEIVVKLESYEFYLNKNGSAPVWLLGANDWRHIEVAKI
jgi:hypothetical protein